MSDLRVPSPPRRAFGVVVPVKPVAVAKSRLGPLGDEVRRALVTAFVLDTVVAAVRCTEVERVLVVTDDMGTAQVLRDLGVEAVPDSGSLSLNASLRQGAAELLRRAPGLRPVALCADLPALRSAELAAALADTDQAPAGFVADAAGIGTTLYTARSLDLFDPRFGTASRSEHSASGATEVRRADIDSVRRDVDTPADLRAAAALGLGHHSARVVSSMRLLDDLSAT